MHRSWIAVVLFVLSVPASAQVEVEIRGPSVTFAVAPALVLISPGIQVVPDHGEEIFFHDGHYWLRHDKRWFKSRHHRGDWKYVGHRHVPPGLAKIPPGHYRHYRHHRRPEQHYRRHDDHGGKHKSRGGESKGQGKGGGNKGSRKGGKG